MARLRTAAILFSFQFVQYAIVCFSYRALSQANTPVCASIDFVYALMQYAVFRKIAESGEHWTDYLAYAAGSACGTILGIVVSLKVLGK